jgi:hypothetical protein
MQVIAQVNKAQQASPGNALQAIFATGERRLQPEEIKHLYRFGLWW